MNKFLNILGSPFLSFSEVAGQMALLFFSTVKMFFKKPFRTKTLAQTNRIYRCELSLRNHPHWKLYGYGFRISELYRFPLKFGADQLVGTVVALGMARELGPVLSAIMVAARAGSAITAGDRHNEGYGAGGCAQRTGCRPCALSFCSRILAGFIVMPMLNAIAVFCGIIGGYLVGIKVLGINKTLYLQYMYTYIEFERFPERYDKIICVRRNRDPRGLL